MTHPVPFERLLGVDYGRKRIGVAGADPLGITVQPLLAITGQPEQALPQIAAVCDEREVDRIVLGLPLNMDGTEGDMAREVRRFAVRLEKVTRRPVVFSDERLSSWSAEEALRELPKKQRGARGRIDAMAAAQILRDYLARRAADDKPGDA